MWLGRGLVGIGRALGLELNIQMLRSWLCLGAAHGDPNFQLLLQDFGATQAAHLLPTLPMERTKKRHGSQAGEASQNIWALDPSRQRRQWQTLFATWRWSAQSKLESNRSNSKTGRVYHNKVISFDSPRGRNDMKRLPAHSLMTLNFLQISQSHTSSAIIVLLSGWFGDIWRYWRHMRKKSIIII